MTDGWTDAVSREDDDAFIDFIQQLFSCLSRILYKFDAFFSAGIHNILVMDNHAEHRDLCAPIFPGSLPCNLNGAHNALTISTWDNTDDFHDNSFLK